MWLGLWNLGDFSARREGERDFSFVCLYLVRVTHPRARQDPQLPHVSLLLAAALLPFHSVSSGFPPIPGLEPNKGAEEDSMTATLASAQKLASQDTVLADEDEEVWL